jgi:hypothetical protein
MFIQRYLSGRTFARTTTGSAGGSLKGGPRFPQGEQTSTERIRYSIDERLVVDSLSSATYEYSISGASVWELWVEDGLGAKTWQLRRGSGPIPMRRGRYSGGIGVCGSVLLLTTPEGHVLRFDFTAVGRNAGIVKLVTPLLEICGVVVGATKIDSGLLVNV